MSRKWPMIYNRQPRSTYFGLVASPLFGGALVIQSIYCVVDLAHAAEDANPLPIQSSDRFLPVSMLTDREFFLSLGVLVFGMAVLAVEYRILSKQSVSSDELLRILVVTLIIVVSMAMVSAGLGERPVSAVLGLFGTIIGYLLGSSQTTTRSKRDEPE